MMRWHILGDSHIDAFRWAAERHLIERPCQFTQVNGATAVGLRNPNSATDALRVFRDHLFPRDPGTIPVLQLGEVDCGFVIWYRARRYGEPVEEQLAASLSAYFAFVDEMMARDYDDIVISAASMPTIRDGYDWGEVANARREIRQSLVERTQLTSLYNGRLAEEATRRGLPYIDISGEVLDPLTGVVSDRLRHPDPSDHHLDPEKAGPLWAAQLNHLVVGGARNAL